MKKTGTLLFAFLLILIACKKTEVNTIVEEVTDEQLQVTHFTKSDLAGLNLSLMLQDNEPKSVYYDQKQRSFYTDEPIQVSYHNQQVSIKAYSPRPIKNAKIMVKSLYYNDPFMVATIDSIPAFADWKLKLDLSAARFYKTLSGKKIFVNGFNTTDIQVYLDSDDSYFQQLKKIKTRWFIRFERYDPNNIEWQDTLRPVHVREAVAMMLNLTYMFSTPNFKDSVYNAWKGYFRDDAKAVIDPDVVFERATTNRTMDIGLVSGRGIAIGWGGGTTFGLVESIFLEQYADDYDKRETALHEFGHVMGYAHDGNMTYAGSWGLNKSWWWNCSQLYTNLSLKKELPVYSRTFLNSRMNPNLYRDSNKGIKPSKYTISERPVLNRGYVPYFSDGFID